MPVELSERITIRYRPEDVARLQREALAVPTTLGELVRARSLRKHPKPSGPKPSVDAALMRQLTGLANNFNQVTHLLHVNQHRGDVPNYDRLVDQFATLHQVLSEVAVAVAERNK